MMLFTKILTLLVLSAQPQPELVSAAPPVVSEVMEQPTVTVNLSGNLLSADGQFELGAMLKASFPIDVKFQIDSATTDVVSVTSDSEAVNVDDVTGFVEDYVWSDHCDD